MTRGPSLGAALSGATTAEAAAGLREESGAPFGPTSVGFLEGMATRDGRAAGCCCDADDDEEDDVADATIVAERSARIVFAAGMAQ